jgi:hypothetical protein
MEASLTVGGGLRDFLTCGTASGLLWTTVSSPRVKDSFFPPRHGDTDFLFGLYASRSCERWPFAWIESVEAE